MSSLLPTLDVEELRSLFCLDRQLVKETARAWFKWPARERATVFLAINSAPFSDFVEVQAGALAYLVYGDMSLNDVLAEAAGQGDLTELFRAGMAAMAQRAGTGLSAQDDRECDGARLWELRAAKKRQPDPGLSEKVAQAVEGVKRGERWPDKVVRKILNGGSVSDLMAIAQYGKLSEEFKVKLGKRFVSDWVWGKLTEGPEAKLNPEETAELLSWPIEKIKWLVESPYAPKWALLTLAHHSDQGVQMAIANHPSLTPALKKELSQVNSFLATSFLCGKIKEGAELDKEEVKHGLVSDLKTIRVETIRHIGQGRRQ